MGTHPIFESDFDCLTAMFRLSKGNQSRKNHKIIHQTTKVSETDAPLSTPAVNAAHHEAEQARLAEVESERVRQIELQEQEATQIVTTAAAVTEQIINEHVMTQLPNAPPVPVVVQAQMMHEQQPVADMEGYINKMRDYMIYMKELEERNARLEYENRVFRQENADLKGQLIQTPNISLKDFPITEQIRVNHMMNQ